MAMKSILAVDDNKDITELVQTMLESYKYDCTTANSANECLDLMKRKNFDLILLDLAMPETSGLDLMAQLKKEGRLAENNIVLFTASPIYTDGDLENIRKEYGFIERVNKPFTDTELISLVEKYI